MIPSYDIIGTIGVLIIIIAYFLLQINRLSTSHLSFSIMNIIGSIMILYSLSFNWNLASFIIEVFWILVSLIGVYNYFRKNQDKEL